MENEIIQFTHLHTHSPEGSLLDGFMRIDKAIDKAKRLGMDALGISDHGTMAAHEKFYNECKKAGIHPVLGMEAYLTPNKDFRKSDFDDVAYVEAESSTEEEVRYVFSFLTEQEVEESEFSWQRVDEITPKKENTRIYNIAKESYILPIVEKTLPEGQETPKGKAARTRMANSYRKAQTLSNKKELYIQADTKMRDLFAWYPRMTHQLLIAMNNEGYQNLLKLNAIGQMDGFYGKPRIDFEDIKEYGKGIAATTACLGGMVPQLILRGRPEVAKKEIQRLIEAFDEVYLEIQPSRQEDQHVVNAQLIEWSRELGVPLIATTDAHMVDKDEMSIHAAMTHIGTSYEDDNDISAYDSAYLMTPEEILRMGIPREALQNAYDLSHRCQVDFLENKETKFPEYDVPEGYTMDEYLRELTEQGLFDIMLKKDYIEDYQAYQERLDYELKIISDKNLSAYFVIVWDYINYAREQGIYVGPGRGSAAGSLIAYCLKLTNLDPLKYNLLFERFLNPERPGLPDIDTDFQHDKKDEVLDYIVKKYGKDRVAKIGTYTQMSSKLVLKDVARVLNIDHNWVNDLNKHLPVENGNVMPLEEAIVEVPEFVRANEKEPELFELASDLQSMPRNTSVHACFVGDTKIRTEDGIEDIINISIGEMVLTHEGRYKPVAKTMVSEVDTLYELDVESYKKTLGTEDHPFYVSELKEIELNTLRKGKKIKVNALSQPVWKALKDLRPGLDYVYLPKKPGQDVKSEDVWPQESTKAESAYQINGNIWLQVKDVVEIELNETTEVYNLEVEDDHSYTANGLAVHNCGIQIAPVPLDENIPLMSAVDRETKERQVVTQYEGGTLEDLGFVKFDILSLKNLTVMHIAVEEIERRHGVHIDINELEPEDPKVFETIKQGNTAGIFQLESPGMTEVFTGLETVDFEALIAGVAMYRPGPMQFIETYQDRANGLKSVQYFTPEFEEFASSTFGLLIYQEQIMQLVQVMGGYSAGEADAFRKSVGKKDEGLLNESLEELGERMSARGYNDDVVRQIADQIRPFAGYGFNRSHAAAYAFIAYQTAYLKTYYPAEFFAASLAVFGDNTDKLITYITNAKENGIEVLPPDVNESEEQFSVIDDKTIRFGLDEIKSMPERAVHSVIKNRPYETAYELVEKNAKSEVNKTAIKVLALSGALDGIASEIGNRQEIKDRLYIITQRTMDEDDPEVFTDRHKLERERQYLGTYMSGHPLDGFKTDVEWVEVERTGETFNVHAVLSTIKRIITKKGDPMAFLCLSFADRAFDGVLFPNSYMREMAFRKDDPLVTVGDLITEGMIVKVTGLFEENHRGEQSFIIRSLTIPVRANADYEEHIKNVQDEKGVEQEAPEVISAPSFDMSNFY